MYKSKSLNSHLRSLIKNKGKDQFDQMLVTVNYGRGRLQELFKWDFTIYGCCANDKGGDDGSFDCTCTGEIQQPLRGQELLHIQRKDSK